MSPHIVRITTAGFVLAALLSTTVVGTTIVGLRRKAAVIITADSKANYRGRAGASEVCKILRTGQTYFAIAGLDHDVLRGTFFQQTIADAFQDIDPFATRIEKVERALKADVLREMIAVQQQDPETYEWIRKDSPNVLSVLLADFENGQPHLAARAFEFVPGSTPDVRVANCDFLTSPGFCYMGKSPEGIHNFGEILKLDPTDPIEATRKLVEKEIHDFPNDVGPPITTIVLDENGMRMIPPIGACPIDVSRTKKSD